MQILPAAQKYNDPMKVVTGEVRMSYCHLAQPRVNRDRPDAPPKYSVTLLLPKSDMETVSKIRAAINAAIESGVAARWNNVRPANPLTPVWDGDGLRGSGEPFGPECRGCWVLTASCVEKPGIVDASLKRVTDPSELYSGIFGRASIRFFAYSSAGKKGIGCGLAGVQKLRDGEPLAPRSTPEDDFGGSPAPAGVLPSPNIARPAGARNVNSSEMPF